VETCPIGRNFENRKAPMVKSHKQEFLDNPINKHVIEFARNSIIPLIEKECKFIAIDAPVKSGKRKLVQAIKYLGPQDIDHIFMSSFHRVADASQRDELKNNGIIVLPLTKIDESVLRKKKKKIIHHDESDYGTGDKQAMSKIYKEFGPLSTENTWIHYSATNEELEVSLKSSPDLKDYREKFQKDHGLDLFVTYVPSPDYCGAKKFLDEGLVIDAEPALVVGQDGNLHWSPQFVQIMVDLSLQIEANKKNGDSCRKAHIVTLRLTRSETETEKANTAVGSNKEIHKFLSRPYLIDELREVCPNLEIWADKDDLTGYKDPINQEIDVSRVEWSSRKKWTKLDNRIPILIVNDQTASRSTDLENHDKIFATHDYRLVIIYNAVIQAQQRVVHHETKYGGFQPIRVYGHLASWKKCANKDYPYKPRESSRIVGHSHQQRNPITKFYEHPKTKGEFQELLKDIRVAYPALGKYRPKYETLTSHPIGDKFGFPRNNRVVVSQYGDLNLDNQGVGPNTPYKIFPCYNGDVFGFAIRYYDVTISEDTRRSIKTMYNTPPPPKKPSPKKDSMPPTVPKKIKIKKRSTGDENKVETIEERVGTLLGCSQEAQPETMPAPPKQETPIEKRNRMQMEKWESAKRKTDALVLVST
jgi:hypothetical protein